MGNQTLHRETEEVKKLLGRIASTQERLKTLYVLHFPAACQHCGKKFSALANYIAEVSAPPLEENRGHLLCKIHACLCRAPLFEVVYNPRDDSYSGIKLRKLFDACVAKLMDADGLTEQAAKDEIRDIIRSHLDVMAFYRNETDFGFFAT